MLLFRTGWDHRYVFCDTSITQKMVADGWIQCLVPPGYLPRATFQVHRTRNVSAGWDLTKFFKFGHVAAVLRPFDYLLHIDFSFIATRNKYFYFLPRFADVEALIRTKPEVELIALRHRERALVRREWQVTTKKKMEFQHLICQFGQAMRAKFGSEASTGVNRFLFLNNLWLTQVVDVTPLFLMGLFVRKVHNVPKLDVIFADTVRTLVSFGLKRDQNVFPLALWNRYGKMTSIKVLMCGRDMSTAVCHPAPNPPASSTIRDFGRPLALTARSACNHTGEHKAYDKVLVYGLGLEGAMHHGAILPVSQVLRTLGSTLERFNPLRRALRMGQPTTRATMHDRLRDFFEEHTTAAAIYEDMSFPSGAFRTPAERAPPGPISIPVLAEAARGLARFRVVVLSRAFDLLVLSHGSWDGGLRGHALMMERHLDALEHDLRLLESHEWRVLPVGCFARQAGRDAAVAALTRYLTDKPCPTSCPFRSSWRAARNRSLDAATWNATFADIYARHRGSSGYVASFGRYDDAASPHFLLHPVWCYVMDTGRFIHRQSGGHVGWVGDSTVTQSTSVAHIAKNVPPHLKAHRMQEHLSSDYSLPRSHREPVDRRRVGNHTSAKQSVLLFITTHLTRGHIAFLRECWPPAMHRSRLLQDADVVVSVVNKHLTRDVTEALAVAFPPVGRKVAYRRVMQSLHTSGGMARQTGALVCLDAAERRGWFSTYDWVIRLNPDVIIRDDGFLRKAMAHEDVDAVFANCNKGRIEDVRVMTDFTAWRPKAVRIGAFRLPEGHTRCTERQQHDSPICNSERAATRAFLPVLESGRYVLGTQCGNQEAIRPAARIHIFFCFVFLACRWPIRFQI